MDQFYDEHHESRNEDAGLLTSWSYIMLHGVDDDSRPFVCLWLCAAYYVAATGVLFPLFSQLCVVMIFLVTVVVCRGIISVVIFHSGSPVLRTEVHYSCFMLCTKKCYKHIGAFFQKENC